MEVNRMANEVVRKRGPQRPYTYKQVDAVNLECSLSSNICGQHHLMQILDSLYFISHFSAFFPASSAEGPWPKMFHRFVWILATTILIHLNFEIVHRAMSLYDNVGGRVLRLGGQTIRVRA